MTHRIRTDHRASGLFLLVVFVLGGLVAPASHRVHHAAQKGSRDEASVPVCDHTRHANRFEDHVPTYDDTLCMLCTRHSVFLDAQPLLFGAALTLLSFTPRLYSHFASTSHSLLSIRGPPSSF